MKLKINKKQHYLKQILSVKSEWELSPKDAHMESLIPNEMISEAGPWEVIDWTMKVLIL